MEFTHFDNQGNARMVDVSEKVVTRRTASATGSIRVSREVMDAVLGHKVKKGDVFTVAQVAGIMGTKRTSELIPMCHLLNLSNASVRLYADEDRCRIHVVCQASVEGKTGVEMEALTGAATALLTVYDMCKAIDRRMCIEDIHLLKKTGGKSGVFSYYGDSASETDADGEKADDHAE